MKKQTILLTGLLFTTFFASAQEFGYDLTVTGTPPSPPPAVVEPVIEPEPELTPAPIVPTIDDSEMPCRTRTIGEFSNKSNKRKGKGKGKGKDKYRGKSGGEGKYGSRGKYGGRGKNKYGGKCGNGGEYGNRENGDNSNSCLGGKFDRLFPNGITIGSEDKDRCLRFTTEESISDFLPSGGAPSALNESLTDPASGEIRNTLAAQVLALSISVRLGRGGRLGYADLRNAVIPEENDMTVKRALRIANKILAGASGESVKNYTPESINQVITKINESFASGNRQGTGYVERRD